MKDYDIFTKHFEIQILQRVNKVELGKQWANNKLLMSPKEVHVTFGCLRRGQNITLLFKRRSKVIENKIS